MPARFIDIAASVAPKQVNATVLLLGQSSVGKRADVPYVAVNCASTPEHPMESELFGVARRPGAGHQPPNAGVQIAEVRHYPEAR